MSFPSRSNLADDNCIIPLYLYGGPKTVKHIYQKKNNNKKKITETIKKKKKKKKKKLPFPNQTRISLNKNTSLSSILIFPNRPSLINRNVP